MKSLFRAVPVLLAALTLVAAACTPPPDGGGGPTTTVPGSPVAVAAANPIVGPAPLIVSFDATGSSDPQGQPLQYQWNFGDGSAMSYSAAPQHSYSTPGQYVAVLTVTNAASLSSVDSVTVTVQSEPDPGVEGAVHVRAGGSSAGDCGEVTNPCGQISLGISRAAAQSKDLVAVAGGTYGRFSVVAGVDVEGGYGQNFRRGPQAIGNTFAVVNASFEAAVGAPVGLFANGITTPTRIANLRIVGGTAPVGQNSFGVLVRNSSSALLLDTLTVVGGTAGAGANGASGAGGWGGPAAGGAAGGAGFEPGGVCNTTSSGQGGNGAGGGGRGGNGGTIDTDCGAVFPPRLPNYNARPGSPGQAGSGGAPGGAGGAAGTDGLPWICTIASGSPVHGLPGGNGAGGTNGANGTGGAPGQFGGTGGLGTNGLPGGGGGGGGANDCNIDDAGAGGGGGGAGGARATVPGQGGAPGATSVAVRLEASSPVMLGVQVTLGTGGRGGNGGAAGPGQPGGAGGAGGAAYDRGGAGGRGGNGGPGGASGVGGGGGGGAAIGLSRDGASAPSGTPSFSGGQGGPGGSGGNTGSTGQVLNQVVA